MVALDSPSFGKCSDCAEGRSNAGIAAQPVIGESAVAMHINNILAKPALPLADGDHRRVLAVLRFLERG